MALPDPITIAARAPMPGITWSKTKFDGYGAEYVDSGGTKVTLMISHNPSKAGNRHYLRVTQTKDAVDPYSGLTRSVTASCSLSIVRPSFGFTDAEMVSVAMLALDTAQDTEVTFAKLLQLQS